MQTTAAHRELAKKFLFQEKQDDFVPLDSLVKLVELAYTEEEAQIVNKLSFVPRNAAAIAKRARRPVHEVEPILKSLSERFLIANLSTKKGEVYSFLPLVPGVFEIQMIAGYGKDDPYFPEFARRFEDFYSEIGDFLRPRLKDIDPKIMRIVPIEQSLEHVVGTNIMPFATDRYSEIVDRNNSFCLVNCPCRITAEHLGNGCDKPKEVCSAMGWVADLTVERGLGRRVSKEEYIDAKARAAEAGLVNLVDNMQDPLQVCSCCGCCCGALRIVTQHNIPTIVTSSHYEAVVDTDVCAGCGTCEEFCQTKAIKVDGDHAVIEYTRCIGCGVCVTKCDDKAVSLRERKDYKPPAENVLDHAVQRYLEIKGHSREDFLPRVGLGVGRLLSKFVQPKVSGPKYKPSK